MLVNQITSRTYVLQMWFCALITVWKFSVIWALPINAWQPLFAIWLSVISTKVKSNGSLSLNLSNRSPRPQTSASSDYRLSSADPHNWLSQKSPNCRLSWVRMIDWIHNISSFGQTITDRKDKAFCLYFVLNFIYF